jgi:hypothetical protein
MTTINEKTFHFNLLKIKNKTRTNGIGNQVLAWDMHKPVAEFIQLMDPNPPVCQM